MPALGGIAAWISVGDKPLHEYGIEIVDDRVKCYVEVPQFQPTALPTMTPGSQTASLPSPPLGNHPHPPASSPSLEYAINWRIQDLTYTMVAVADIDGMFKIEKIHLGKGTITAAKNTQTINSVPVTDDWSKCRLLTFVKLHAEEHAQLPKEQVGTITLSLYRSGRASLSSGLKTTATGFHTKTTPDVNTLVKTTTVDGLYSKSHATGLGPITFGSPKKVWTAGTRDKVPYVTFEFLYRSRELITETLPDEGWELAAAPPSGNINFEKGIPAAKESRHEIGSPSTPPSSFPPGANVGRRPSIAKRAKKWASEVKQSTQSIKISRGKDSGSKVQVVSTPMDAINNPFAPRSHDLPPTPTESEHDHNASPPTPVPHEEAQVPEEPPVASGSGSMKRKPVVGPLPDI